MHRILFTALYCVLFLSCAQPAWSAPAVAGAGACVEDATTACLRDGRFRVRADFDGNGAAFVPPGAPPLAGAALYTHFVRDTALFSFRGPQQFELAVRIVEGCPVNGRFWVFAAAPTDSGLRLTIEDTVGSAERVYLSPAGVAAVPVADTDAFECAVAKTAAAADLPRKSIASSGPGRSAVSLGQRSSGSRNGSGSQGLDARTAGGKGVCGHAMCLRGGRFGLDVAFSSGNGNGTGIALPEDADHSALAGLSSQDNLDVLASVVDGSSDNGAFWFLASALSDWLLVYTLTDTQSSRTSTFSTASVSGAAWAVTLLDRGDPLALDVSAPGGGVAAGGNAEFTLRLVNAAPGDRDFRLQVPTPPGMSAPRIDCTATAPASCPLASATGPVDLTGVVAGGGALQFVYGFDVPSSVAAGSTIQVDASAITLADALAGDRTTSASAAVVVASAAAVHPRAVQIPALGWIGVMLGMAVLLAAGLRALPVRGT